MALLLAPAFAFAFGSAWSGAFLRPGLLLPLGTGLSAFGINGLARASKFTASMALSSACKAKLLELCRVGQSRLSSWQLACSGVDRRQGILLPWDAGCRLDVIRNARQWEEATTEVVISNFHTLRSTRFGEAIDHTIRVHLVNFISLRLKAGHDCFDLLDHPEAAGTIPFKVELGQDLEKSFCTAD